MPVKVALMILLVFNLAIPAEVTLEWDHSVSESVTGYRIYYGQESRQYSNHEVTEYATTHTIQDLGAGTWYFTTTAIDAAGNESGFSNEVSKEILPELRITSMSSSATWFGVVCLATSSVPASAVFRYARISPASGWTTIIASPDPDRTQHRAVMYFEAGHSAYFNYEWILTDAKGNSISEIGTFQTK
jgi:imidazole glycerol phosphate synthase subunit HisF